MLKWIKSQDETSIRKVSDQLIQFSFVFEILRKINDYFRERIRFKIKYILFIVYKNVFISRI